MGKKRRKSGKVAPAAPTRSSVADWEADYIAASRHGEQLLIGGRVDQARDVFESILTRLDEAPSYARAVILGRLGRCSLMRGRPTPALAQLRQAMAITDRLAISDGVTSLRGMLHADIGDTLRAAGRYADARRAYETALQIAEDLDDLRGQGVDLGQLGALALAEGRLEEARERYRAALQLFQQVSEQPLEAIAWQQLGSIFQHQQQWEEAERHYREALRIREETGNPAGAARLRGQLAFLGQQSGNPTEAEARYRTAIQLDRQIGDSMLLGHHLGQLAELLQNLPGRLAEARQLAEEAVSLTRIPDHFVATEAWKRYGILADIDDREAASTADSQRRTLLRTRARDYRQLQQHAPKILAALARLDKAPSHARAVLIGRLGRCHLMGGRPELALAQLRQALAITEQLAPDAGVQSLRSMLHAELGDMLHTIGHHAEAHQAHEAAQLRNPTPESVPASISEPGLMLFEELSTEYVFEPDLLLDGRCERRTIFWATDLEPLAEDLRPMLVPCARSCMDEQGAVRFFLPPEEPILERRPGCIVMRRTRREVVVAKHTDVIQRLIRQLDGTRTVAELLCGFAADARAVAARLLAALVATGTLDVSGRPLGRFLHSITKKGVLPGGGLEGEQVLHLATDGNYRAYPEARRIAVGRSTPERLRSFHALTRARRSRRDYPGLAVSRDEFDALLHTACGVTGVLSQAGREAPLRAYPSSGALYAVEIYPVVFRVEGLESAIYHYRAVENELEIVKPDLDPTRLLAALLPVEREMVAGSAAMICLTGCFPRHERKYGEGGYRMLVAEAGHLSQNLILAATALDLSARPFGGVFDELLNQDLGLDSTQEQFLLAVLVGHAGGAGEQDETAAHPSVATHRSPSGGR